jgi:hypothetical protein
MEASVPASNQCTRVPTCVVRLLVGDVGMPTKAPPTVRIVDVDQVVTMKEDLQKIILEARKMGATVGRKT